MFARFVLKRSQLPHRLFIIAIIIALLAVFFISGVPTTQAQSSGFVTRSGNKLMLNGSVFRAAGTNLSWLGLDENVNGIDYPTQFRVNDALDTAKEMGARVIRSHTLGISFGCSNGAGSENVPNRTGKCMQPSLGVYNETAFQVVDYAIYAAGQRGFKLIIPLVDEWQWYHGGRYTFTEWRGVSQDQFWTNSTVIGDFKGWINHLLNRVNTYNGIAYKNDPTIMAWETGNELSAPGSWTETIASYIKSVDSNHLVVNGHTGDFGNLGSGNIDIYVDHFYPMNLSYMNQSAQTVQNGGKVYYVGEFGWNTPDLSSVISSIESNGTSLDTFWQIFPHRDDYGYVQHNDGYTMHYPGDDSSMRSAAQALRAHFYRMRGQSMPASTTYGAPLVTSYQNGQVKWRGAAGGDRYTVQVAPSGNGPWTTVCDKCVTDNNLPYTVNNGNTCIRVAAASIDGVLGNFSDPYGSNCTITGTLTPSYTPSITPTQGPITTITDDLNDWSKSFSHTANLGFDTTNSGLMGNDGSRADRSTSTNENIVWKLSSLTSAKVTAYFWPYEAVSQFSFATSSDGSNWTTVNPTISGGTGDWIQYVYTFNNLNNANYFKVTWNNTSGTAWTPQLGQVVLTANITPTNTATPFTPDPTPVQPTNTNTPVPPTSTFAPPTNTPINPTVTTIPPTSTNTFVPPTITPSVPPTIQPTVPVGNVKVQIQSTNTDSNQQSQFNFKLLNTGSTAQSNLSVRVYFTTENGNAASSYVLEKYWDQSGVATVSGPTAYSGSTYYFTVSWGANALSAGSSWEFHTALHLSSWATTFDSTNDWWRSGGYTTSFADTTHLPAYTGSTLTWGAQP